MGVKAQVGNIHWMLESNEVDYSKGVGVGEENSVIWADKAGCDQGTNQTAGEGVW